MTRSLRRVFATGASVTLLAALALAPPAAAAETAVLSGTVTALDGGAPVAGATVIVRDPGLGYEWARVYTDGDGRYRVAGMPDAVQVKIQVQATGFVEQWSGAKPDARNAFLVKTSANQPTAADFALRTEAGSIEGAVRDPEGRAAANARLVLRLPGEGWSVVGWADPDGRYRFDRIPPGVYEMGVLRGDFLGLTVTGIAIEANQVTVRDFDFLTRTSEPSPTGRIEGRITDGPNGPGVPGAEVVLFSQPFTVMARTTTDATGAYAINNISSVHSFRVRAVAPGFTDVWAPNAPDFGNAVPYQVSSARPTVQVSISLRRDSGAIRGQITDPAGTGVRALVYVQQASSSRIWRTFTRIDGSYEQPNLAVGNYQVSTAADGLGIQWVPGKEQQAEAGLIPVADRGTTEVNEQFRPRGIVEVLAVDATTGVTISNSCVSLSAHWYSSKLCTGSDGVYRFSDVPPGSVSIQARADNTHFPGYVTSVAAHSAQTTRITLPLHPAGTITTTVRRAADGSIPVTCALAVPTGLARPSPVDEERVWCNRDSRGMAVETLTLGPLSPEPMQIFVTGNREKGYGAQWLGTTGGTGDRRLAAVVTPRPGQPVSAPQIKLDPAGSITGVVRERASGTPLVGAYVRPFGIVTGLQMVCSSGPYYTTCTDENGRYRLDGLGPYSWPVEFAATGHANQWSGGATNRFDATLVPVKAGATTAVDASLGVEAKFTNFNRGTNPAEHWSVVAYHATTGDMISSAWYGGPTLGGLSAGPVVLQYHPSNTDSCWYSGSPSTFDPPRRQTVPTVVNVSAGQAINGLKLIPGSTCLAGMTSRTPVPRRPGPAMILPGAELSPAGTGAAAGVSVQNSGTLADVEAGQQPVPRRPTPAAPTPVSGCAVPWIRPTIPAFC